MKNKSQGTSKAGEMDWADEFDKLEARDDMMSGIGITYKKLFGEHNTQHIKDFIHTAIQKAIAQERERIVQEEIGELEKEVRLHTLNWHDNKACPMCKLYSKKLDIITNNHE